MPPQLYSGNDTSRDTLIRANGRSTVIVFGEVLADIFPDRTVLGGAPFNVACHLQAFGLSPVMISRLGDDALCAQVMKAMEDKGMTTLGMQFDRHNPTGQVLVHMEYDGHRFEIVPHQAYDYIHPGVARMTTLAVHPAMVYFGSLAQRHHTSRRALKTVLRGSRTPRFLDINLREPWYEKRTLQQSLQLANIVKINDDELLILARMFELAGNDATEQARSLMQRFDLQQLFVTCGEAGAWQMDREGKRTEAVKPDELAEFVDTVGAGDGFASVCILGAMKGWAIDLTLARANAFAGAICGIRGAIPEDAGLYAGFMRKWGV